MSAIASFKDRVGAAVDEAAGDLVALSLHIHSHPELAFHEQIAATAVSELCRKYGFEGGPGAAGIETAARLEFGAGPLNVGYCAEYDSLPGIGHACGHNLIAASSVGAAIGLAAVADELALSVTLLGTPAEERGGGKIEMLKGGAFKGIHAAMMAHPGPLATDYLLPSTLSVAQFEISYKGKTSHASVAPHLGVNAADAMTVAQVAIGLLRQQLAPGNQVHGLVKEISGAANVIPADAKGEFFVRARSIKDVIGLRTRVLKCFEAGAVATGCACQVENIGDPYADMNLDPWLSNAYKANAEILGRAFAAPTGSLAQGSTDMANVSHALPAIHPIFGLNTLPAFLHQPEFTAHTNTPQAHQTMLVIAKALAWTAIDAAVDEPTRARLIAGSVGS